MRLGSSIVAIVRLFSGHGPRYMLAALSMVLVTVLLALHELASIGSAGVAHLPRIFGQGSSWLLSWMLSR